MQRIVCLSALNIMHGEAFEKLGAHRSSHILLAVCRK